MLEDFIFIYVAPQAKRNLPKDVILPVCLAAQS